MFDRLSRLIGYFSDFPLRSASATILVVLFFSFLEFGLHLTLARFRTPPLADAAIDASLVGLSVGFSFWIILATIRHRRDQIRRELERIAELNHEIRNALQVISHSHFNAEPHHRDMVLESVERVQNVLKRVFPFKG